MSALGGLGHGDADSGGGDAAGGAAATSAAGGHAAGGNAASADAVGRVDWESLLAAAKGAARSAYAPYSNYPVGAAAIVADDGRVVTGCNVENASYGVGLCAECGLVGQLAATGGGTLAAFACVNGLDEVIMPCGRCRQLLNEFKAPGMRILTPRGELAFDEILPQAFGPADLEHVRDAQS